MLSIGFVGERARATRSAQATIETTWVWQEKTLLQWDGSLVTYSALEEAAMDLSAESGEARSFLDTDLAELHHKTVMYLTLFKTMYRNDGEHAERLSLLTSRGGGRRRILHEAGEFESAWKTINPTWEPETGKTLAIYKAFRENCLDRLQGYSDKKSDWREKAGEFNKFARGLNNECIGWYTAATAMFPVGSAEGDMIRGTVPTQPGTPLPGDAEVILNDYPAPGSVSMSVFAPHATKYDVYRMGPGVTEFTKIATDAPEGEFVDSGLAAGDYQYKAVGKNSRGSGPESNIASVTIS